MKAFFTKIISTLVLGAALIGSSLVPGLSTTAMAAGLMVPTNASQTALEIKSHHVDVTIEDGYAITQVDQVFSNSNSKDAEAVYSFPVPEKGAVSEFTIWIDGKPVTGEVLEKEKARSLYEQEKAAGRDAGITEKKKHYRFEVSVSPVRAGQDAKIRLVYIQPTHMDSSMGRYVYPLEEGDTDDKANSFWSYKNEVKEDFSFNVKLRSGYPVNGVRLPQHPQAAITQSNDQEWQVSLGSQGQSDSIEEETSVDQQRVNQTAQSTNTLTSNTQSAMTLDKDIVMYWRLVPNLPGSIDMVTYRAEGEKRGTFMMTVTPGDDLAKITEGRDWAFVLDMSGSMSGKYQTMVDGVQRALGSLNPEDRFQLILFDNAVMPLTTQWIPATTESVTKWSNKLASTGPRGGTNIHAGLVRAFDELDADRTGVIVLVTDGEANVGVTEKKEFIKLMEGHDVRLFTAVMGNGSNRPMLKAMTAVSNGFAVNVSNSDDIAGKLMEFTSKATHQAMHDIDLSIKGIRTADLTIEKATSLYRGEQLIVLGHYWGKGEANVILGAKVSGQKKEYSTRFNFDNGSTNYPEIERLWAYAKIENLQNQIDYIGDGEDLSSAIVDLAVENSLVTDYTSMVVMTDEQFKQHGIERNNKKRVEIEAQAKQQRAQAPVTSHRVDNNQPAFQMPRMSHGSGGGSLNPLLLLPLILLGLFNRRKNG